jgi:Holliday junction resolvase RusA-like endonuclease
MIVFNFPIDPVAKGRPRFAKGRTYTPKKTKDFEAHVKALAREQYKNGPIRGALKMTVVFTIKRPKTVKREHPTVKPDTSNMVKSLEDALNKIAYEDDSQIVSFCAAKRYGESGSIYVEIEPYLLH